MSIKKHIPNVITCGNLLCGCIAIVCAFKGDLLWTAYLVGIAAVLDFFDGFCARLLKVGGEMGKQLDSLADMVTFGVVPGIVMYHLLLQSLFMSTALSQEIPDTSAIAMSEPLLPYIAFLITIFSAMRLAKFNIDTRQTSSFIGVPTPANSILICSFPLIIKFHEKTHLEYNALLFNPYVLVFITLLMSYLLVAELPLFALKFKNFGWADNKIRYIFLIISVILLILFQFIAIPFIIFLYIVLSISSKLSEKQKNTGLNT